MCSSDSIIHASCNLCSTVVLFTRLLLQPATLDSLCEVVADVFVLRIEDLELSCQGNLLNCLHARETARPSIMLGDSTSLCQDYLCQDSIDCIFIKLLGSFCLGLSLAMREHPVGSHEYSSNLAVESAPDSFQRCVTVSEVAVALQLVEGVALAFVDVGQPMLTFGIVDTSKDVRSSPDLVLCSLVRINCSVSFSCYSGAA